MLSNKQSYYLQKTDVTICIPAPTRIRRELYARTVIGISQASIVVSTLPLAGFKVSLPVSTLPHGCRKVLLRVSTLPHVGFKVSHHVSTLSHGCRKTLHCVSTTTHNNKKK